MAITEPVARPVRSDSVFYPAMAIGMGLLVFVGFSPTYYLKSWFDSPQLDVLRMVHGAVFTSWIGLLTFQTAAVAANRRDVHRRTGVIGAAIAVLMVVLGTVLAISALRAGHAPAGAPSAEAFFAIPIFNIAVFALLVGLGIAWRSRSAFHKRFMILATAAIVAAAIARIPAGLIVNGGPPVFYGLTDLLIILCAGYDVVTIRRVHPATWWSGTAIVASQVLSLAVGTTPLWLAMAKFVAA